jgi:hypothetical protein
MAASLIPTQVEQTGNAPITVVINWQAGLKKQEKETFRPDSSRNRMLARLHGTRLLVIRRQGASDPIFGRSTRPNQHCAVTRD